MKDFKVQLQFNSLHELNLYTKQEKIEGYKCTGYGQEHTYPNDRFYMTESLEAAQDLCERGWQEGAKKLGKGIDLALAASSSTMVTGSTHDVVGPIPDIGAFCAGDPECMISPAEPMEVPVVRIIVDCNMIAKVTTRQAINRGAAILAACKKIEDSGQRVEIIAVCSSEVGHAGHEGTYGVVVKAATQDFNLYSLAYCLIHPAYYRRHGFKIWALHSYTYSSSRSSSELGGQKFYGKPDIYFPCINSTREWRKGVFNTIRNSMQYVERTVNKALSA